MMGSTVQDNRLQHPSLNSIIFYATYLTKSLLYPFHFILAFILLYVGTFIYVISVLVEITLNLRVRNIKMSIG